MKEAKTGGETPLCDFIQVAKDMVQKLETHLKRRE